VEVILPSNIPIRVKPIKTAHKSVELIISTYLSEVSDFFAFLDGTLYTCPKTPIMVP